MNTQDESDIVTAATTQPAYRLSILDLMLGMAIVAVVLVLEQNLPNARMGGKCKDPVWFAIFFSHAVAAKALVLFGMLLLGRAVLAGRKSEFGFFWNPGHVLLFSTFLFACQRVVLGVLFEHSNSILQSTGIGLAAVLPFLAQNVFSILSFMVTLSAAMIGASVFKWNRIWVTSLCLLSLLGFMGLMSSAYFHYSASLSLSQRFGKVWAVFNMVIQFTFLISSALVVAATVYDLVKGTWRDMPHWIGTSGWLLGSLVGYLLFQIARLVLTPGDLHGY